MAAPGRCEHPRCGRAATEAVQIADMTRAVHCCDAHAADFRICASATCDRLAQVVITFGDRRRPGLHAREQLWLCAPCAEQFQRAPTVTINGRRLINDGAGWLLPIPSRVGQG
jgi:hypothetical protein